jgi:predicted nucleic acid-binding protein
LFLEKTPVLLDQSIAEALALALRHQISFWDSLYLALAINQRADLITADQRLYRSVSRHYPFVKLLGS